MCTKMQYNYALKLFIIIRLYTRIEIKINKYYDFHHIYLMILKFLMTYASIINTYKKGCNNDLSSLQPFYY